MSEVDEPVWADLRPQPIKLRAPLLSRGVDDTEVYVTPEMWMHLKIYSDGGENDLHAHPKEEHAFLVLQGQATFYDKDGNTLVAEQYEGVLLPKGTLYRFLNSGEGNLAMIRIGVGSNARLPGKADERKGPDGRPMTYNPTQIERNMRVPIPIPGAFFGAKE